MQTPDLINGIFEAGGACVNFLNIKALVRDKVVKGINPWIYVWFSSWGVFNLYYYPHLGQWLSFFGGSMIVFCNLIWLALWAYYEAVRNVVGRRSAETP